MLSDDPFRTVLEVGCGFGRMTRRLLRDRPSVERWTGIDIAPAQVEAARRFVRDERASFEVGTFDALAGREADLVLASEVLMHLRPPDAQRAIEAMWRSARRLAVNVDWRSESEREKGGYCFTHDYDSIWRALGATVERIDLPRQAIWIARKSHG